ncbi:rod shape-determining protein MreC [Calidifontibacter terrae]
MAYRPSVRRRVLAGGVAGCLLLVVVDRAAPGATEPLRSTAADVVSPVANLITHRDATITRLTRERDAARSQAGDAGQNARTLTALRALRGSAAADGRVFVAAEVIGWSTGTDASLPAQVTLDAGSRDGITTDLTVISAGGLVGRVTAVARTSCTVQLITDPSSVVGVKVGANGVLAQLSSKAPAGLPARSAGTLTIRVAGLDAVAKGDTVRTLGSVDDTPYVAGVPVGTVVSVDPDRGQGARTAVVRPAVDMGSLGTVGIVLPAAQVGSRPLVRGPQ